MSRSIISKTLKRTNKILFDWITITVVAFNGMAVAAPLFLTSTAHASAYYVPNCAFSKSGTTWTLQRDCTDSTGQINIPAGITVDGNNYTISSHFAKTNNSNNAALGIIGNDVTIKNLTINGAAANTAQCHTQKTCLHGINVYESKNVVLDNVTLENNGYDGLVVNGSTVTVDNITTMNNGWGGIDVDLGSGVPGPAKLTVNGVSHQSREQCAIVVDNVKSNVSVVDTNSQYVRQLAGNTACYQQIPAAPSDLTFYRGNTVIPSGSTVNYTNVTLEWHTVPDTSRYQVRVTDPNGNSQHNRNTGWYTFNLSDPSRYGFFGTMQGTWKYEVRDESTITGQWSNWSSPVSLLTYDTHTNHQFYPDAS